VCSLDPALGNRRTPLRSLSCAVFGSPPYSSEAPPSTENPCFIRPIFFGNIVFGIYRRANKRSSGSRRICRNLLRPCSCSILTRASQAASLRSPRSGAMQTLRILAARQLTPFSVPCPQVSMPTLGPGYLTRFAASIPHCGHAPAITNVSSPIHQKNFETNPGAPFWCAAFRAPGWGSCSFCALCSVRCPPSECRTLFCTLHSAPCFYPLF